MNDEQKEALEPPMVARFEVKDLGSAVVQKTISDALQSIPGVSEVSFERDAVHVEYDPLQTSEAELKKAIENTGHSISAAETEFEAPRPDLPREQSGESFS
jgi:copper chaperone CopZ